MIRWEGGTLDEIDLTLPRSRPVAIRTDEDTIELIRRLARLYPDNIIAGILNRQQRTTGYGHRFEGRNVASLRIEVLQSQQTLFETTVPAGG